MRLLLTGCLLLAVIGSPGAAQSPGGTQTPEAPFTPSVRLLYESDARAYYRPCG